MNIVVKICPICTAQYNVESYKLKHGKGTTCSRTCSYIFRGLRKEKRETRPCSSCGQLVTRRPCQFKERVFCSQCANQPLIYPVDYKLNSWTVVSTELKDIGEKYHQLCKCVCGVEQWLAVCRLTQGCSNPVTHCLDCSRKNKQCYGNLDPSVLAAQISEGKLIKEIAKEHGIHCGTVSRRLRQWNIEKPILESKLLEGKIFGKWKVGKLSFVSSRKGHDCLLYECTCACGVKQMVSPSHLLDEDSTQCKKCAGAQSQTINSPHWTGHGEISGFKWGGIKRSCKYRSKKMLFNISIEDAWNLFLEQDRICPISGDLLYMKTTTNDYDYTASLDRINSSIGYIDGNVQWVNKKVNRMKWDIPEEDFIELCKAVTAYRTHGKRILDDPTIMPPYKTTGGPGSCHWKGCGEITGNYWYTLKRGAALRNINFEISIEQAWAILLSQDKRCVYTGVLLMPKKTCNDKNWTASLDRIDSNLHYTQGNIQWVHKSINQMKSDIPENEFLYWCNKIAVYNDFRASVREELKAS